MPKLRIENTWDGTPLKPDEAVEVEVLVEQDRLVVLVNAPFHGDKAPPGYGGSTDRLWEYEVVELFMAGKDSRYLEIELGPHGHYLVLRLKGVRQVEKKGLAMEYKAEIYGGAGAARLICHCHIFRLEWTGQTLTPCTAREKDVDILRPSHCREWPRIFISLITSGQ